MSTQHFSHTCQTQKKFFAQVQGLLQDLFSFVYPPVRAWCDVDGLRSRFPKAWTQIIRGRRPQAVKWPPADRRRQDSSKPNPSAASPKGPSDVKSTSTPESKVGRLEAALKVREEEQSEARTALEEALRKAKAEGPRCSTPQDRMAEARTRVTWLKAALQLLGEDTP